MPLLAMTQLAHVIWRGPSRCHLTVIDKGHKKMGGGLRGFLSLSSLHSFTSLADPADRLSTCRPCRPSCWWWSMTKMKLNASLRVSPKVSPIIGNIPALTTSHDSNPKTQSRCRKQEDYSDRNCSATWRIYQ